MFDWGAKEVALLMEAGSLNFAAAVRHIGPRPWLIDHVDQWVHRMRGPPHKEHTPLVFTLPSFFYTKCWILSIVSFMTIFSWYLVWIPIKPIVPVAFSC